MSRQIAAGSTRRRQNARRVLAVLQQHRADALGLSVRELASEIGLALRTVVASLRLLEREYQYIERLGGGRRGVRLTDTAL